MTDFFQRAPFLRSVCSASKEEKIEATKEVFLISLISFLPIVFSIAIDYVYGKSGSAQQAVSFFDIIGKNFKAGEVLIYSAAFLAPVLFVLYKYNKKGRPLDDFLWHISIVVVLLASSSVVFALSRAGILPSKPFYVQCSAILIFALSVFLWWVSLIQQNLLTVFEDISAEQQNDLRDRMKRTREGAK